MSARTNTLVGLGSLAIGIVGLVWSRKASAAPPPVDPARATPAPVTPATVSIPRNGPNGSILLSDAPSDIRRAYCLAFEPPQSDTACALAVELSNEADRIEREAASRFAIPPLTVEESLDSLGIVEREYYETIVEQLIAADARCRGAVNAEQAAINSWRKTLDRYGLDPTDIWNDAIGGCYV